MRLMEHPKSGLLRSVLRTAKLGWLAKAIPEDFQQECALFLLGRGANEEKYSEFARAAATHFYRVAVAYGWKRPKRSSYYKNPNIPLDPPWVEEGEDAEKINRYLLTDPWPEWEGDEESRSRIGFCKVVLAMTCNGTGARRWSALQAFLAEKNLSEIAFLTGWSEEEAVRYLADSIAKIRQRAGISPDAPMPSLPRRGKVRMKAADVRKLGAGKNPNPNKPRLAVEIPQGAKIAGIGFVIELVDLKGKEKLKGYPIVSLIKFRGE